MTKSTWIIVGVIAVIGLSVGGYFLTRAILRGRIIAPFETHVSKYVETARGAPIPNQTKEGPGIPPPFTAKAGKFIVVDEATGKVDEEVYFSLPEDRQAKSPEEVGTIVVLIWRMQQVGTYSGGGLAQVQSCDVRCVTPDGKHVAAPRSFRGSSPPQSKKRNESGTGSKPVENVVQFLLNLPTQ